MKIDIICLGFRILASSVSMELVQLELVQSPLGEEPGPCSSLALCFVHLLRLIRNNEDYWKTDCQKSCA